MEQGRVVLNLPAAGPQLELAAAAGPDAALGAVFDRFRRRGGCRRTRDGLMLIARGGNGSASMSSTEWMIASQVMRSRWGSRMASASSVRAGSSRKASGKASTRRRYSADPRAGRRSCLRIDPSGRVTRRRRERSSATKSSSQELCGSSLNCSSQSSSQRRTRSVLGGSPRRIETTKRTGRLAPHDIRERPSGLT